MRKLHFVACLFALVCFSACNFTEEIYLQEDGSGSINIHFDGSELMGALGAMGGTTYEAGQQMDTTVVFRDYLAQHKDSISQLSEEEQAKLKRLEPFTFKVAMSEKAEQMDFDLFADFRDVGEVVDVLTVFQEASTIGPKTSATSSQEKPRKMPTNVVYSFANNSFSRKITVLDKDLLKQEIDSLQSMEMFLSGSSYTFKYHFPRRVKETNIEGATFSMDGKTLIYEVDFLEMLKNPESMAIEVELEN